MRGRETGSTEEEREMRLMGREETSERERGSHEKERERGEVKVSYFDGMLLCVFMTWLVVWSSLQLAAFKSKFLLDSLCFGVLNRNQEKRKINNVRELDCGTSIVVLARLPLQLPIHLFSINFFIFFGPFINYKSSIYCHSLGLIVVGRIGMNLLIVIFLFLYQFYSIPSLLA